MTNPQYAPGGFTYVTPTNDEVAEYRRRNHRDPAMYRLVCDRCGRRIWGSGLGVGAHRRKHRRETA